MNSRNVLKGAKLTITISLVSAAISAASLNLIPYIAGFEDGKNKVISYAAAAVFWLGILLAMIASHFTKRTLKRYREKLIAHGHVKKHQPIGIFGFSKDWRMWVLYVLMIFGLTLIVTDIIFGYVPELIMFPVISVTILSFAVHCVVDGRNYKAYKLIKEIVNNETNR